MEAYVQDFDAKQSFHRLVLLTDYMHTHEQYKTHWLASVTREGIHETSNSMITYKVMKTIYLTYS